MKRVDTVWALVLVAVTFAPFLCAAGDAANEAALTYQERLLTSPTNTERHAEEAKMRVFIYDGVRDKVVSRAMDEQPDRIEHMMFVNTKVTDDEGKVQVGPDKRPLTEDSDPACE